MNCSVEHFPVLLNVPTKERKATSLMSVAFWPSRNVNLFSVSLKAPAALCSINQKEKNGMNPPSYETQPAFIDTILSSAYVLPAVK